MDQSMGKLPDPVVESRHEERRRSVRHKLHMPVYASFNGPKTGMVLDLSELLDLHEGGFSVQTSECLEKHRPVTLCLDLPETKSYIHGSGQVVWSDDAGRAGIRFSSLPDSYGKILREWLFANLLIACANHATRSDQLASRQEECVEPGPAVEVPNGTAVVPVSGGNEKPASMEAVRSEVQEISDDVDAVLQLITNRARSLTGAEGAALALVTEGRMICRARTGDTAPLLGTPLDTSHGLSGECVRSGVLVSCEDTERDPRVDADACRALGIGSLMAAPIVSSFGVAGLVEIFASQPRRFTKIHELVLDQLVAMVPKIVCESQDPEYAQWSAPQAVQRMVEKTPLGLPMSRNQAEPIEATSTVARSEDASEQAVEVHDPEANSSSVENAAEHEAPAHLLYRVLLGLAIAVSMVALGYLFGPAIKNWVESRQQPSITGPFKAVKADAIKSTEIKVAEAASAHSGESNGGQGSGGLSSGESNLADRSPRPKSFSELRELAEGGDADAQWQMGVRYHDGEGVAHDDAQAVQWFLRAAEQGNTAAEGALGAYYWRGRGVSEDLSKAYFWSAIAMAQGDEISKSRVEGLSSQMTKAQVLAARQQAEAWLRSHNQPTKSAN